MNVLRTSAALSLLLLLSLASEAQTAGAKPDIRPDEKPADRPAAQANGRFDNRPFETIFLKNETGPNQSNEVLTSIRLILEPDVKLYLDTSRNAIVVRATPEQLALIKHIVSDLDTPPKAYRVTYTITELDGDRRVGVQHFGMNATAGLRSVLKDGSRIPVATSQVASEYFDVGLNFDFTADSIAGGVQLKSKVDQSTIVLGPNNEPSPAKPVIRESTLEGSFVVPFSRPVVLGSLDVPGSTRHLDVEVVVDPIK